MHRYLGRCLTSLFDSTRRKAYCEYNSCYSSSCPPVRCETKKALPWHCTIIHSQYAHQKHHDATVVGQFERRNYHTTSSLLSSWYLWTLIVSSTKPQPTHSVTNMDNNKKQSIDSFQFESIIEAAHVDRHNSIQRTTGGVRSRSQLTTQTDQWYAHAFIKPLFLLVECLLLHTRDRSPLALFIYHPSKVPRRWRSLIILSCIEYVSARLFVLILLSIKVTFSFPIESCSIA